MNKSETTEVTTEELTEAEKKKMTDRQFDVLTSWVRVKPCGQVVPKAYAEFSEQIRQFKFRKQDVIVLSYPKTGITWLGEILWAMANINQLHLADEIPILERTYVLYNDAIRPVREGDDTSMTRRFRANCPGKEIKDGVVLSLAEAAPDRRILRSHLFPELHDPNMFDICKVVFLIRNPKDTCTSCYHFTAGGEEFAFYGNPQQFVEQYTSGLFYFGCYWEHMRKIWPWRNHPNVHLVYFEDLKKNLHGELEKLNQFCGFQLSIDQLNRVAEHTSIQNLKKREAKLPYIGKCKNGFFREGKIGGWKALSSPEVEARMDAWIAEGSKGLDLNFKYD